MLNCLRNDTPCLPRWWINISINHSLSLAVAALLLTAGITIYAVQNFKINTDLTDMISNKLPFRQTYKAYMHAFPELADTIVIVIDAATPELAVHARKQMASRLRQEKQKFKTIYLPGGGIFFERNGLLYLSVKELENLEDNLARVQPFLATLYQDLSLKGLFTVFDKVLRTSDVDISDNERLFMLFDRLGEAFDYAEKRAPYYLSWQEIMLGKNDKLQQTRQFIIIDPHLDFSQLFPAKATLNVIYRITRDLELNSKNGISVRLTGDIVQNHEDLMGIQKGIASAAITSLVLVGIVLYLGLQSGRLVLASLATLIIGLIWTMGFAILVFGSLNLISITFAVLFIGLGVDYSIQYCLRYKEIVVSGRNRRDAIRKTSESIGNAFVLCTISTAIGFYAFAPTAYAGASELGVISGTGMLINFITNLTVLPALLRLIPFKMQKKIFLSLSPKYLRLPEKHAGGIVAAAIVAGIGAVLLLPGVGFDYNPLNLSDPAAESVQTAADLFDSGDTSPWTISVLTGSLQKATQLAERLEALKEVEMAITIADFIPANQPEKLEMVSDLALFMPDSGESSQISTASYKQKINALRNFAEAIKLWLQSHPDAKSRHAASLKQLHENINRFIESLNSQADNGGVLRALEADLLFSLKILLENLDALLHPTAFDQSELPPELIRQYVSDAGLYRIEVFPKQNLTNINALKKFVGAVRTVTPQATAAPVTILESGNAIVSAFKWAFLAALVLITTFLLIVQRYKLDVIFILTPLVLAVLLTIAAGVLLKIQFNFANIIVIPLVLGVGVDYSIHLVHRFRAEFLSDRALLQASTSRAIFFSALTTIVSFGSLSFLAHRGTASMGILLTLCICFMIICSLFVLPALFKRYGHRFQTQ